MSEMVDRELDIEGSTPAVSTKIVKIYYVGEDSRNYYGCNCSFHISDNGGAGDCGLPEDIGCIGKGKWRLTLEKLKV